MEVEVEATRAGGAGVPKENGDEAIGRDEVGAATELAPKENGAGEDTAGVDPNNPGVVDDVPNILVTGGGIDEGAAAAPNREAGGRGADEARFEVGAVGAKENTGGGLAAAIGVKLN